MSINYVGENANKFKKGDIVLLPKQNERFLFGSEPLVYGKVYRVIKVYCTTVCIIHGTGTKHKDKIEFHKNSPFASAFKVIGHQNKD